jgi:hypothetical protein
MPSREASLRNLEKALAAWSHRPRPWRSVDETRVIRQLVWQWFNAAEPRKWSARAIARWLGVSHTYIQKLVRKFQADPDRMRRNYAGVRPATFESLERAREFTRLYRESGWLRGPKCWRVIVFNMARIVVPTKAEEQRRAAEAQGRQLGPTYVPFHELPLWARGMPSYPAQTPCDPLIAVRRATEENHSPRLQPIRLPRRWRLGMRHQ